MEKLLEGRVRTLLSVLSLLLACGVVVAMPYLVGVDWGAIWHELTKLDPLVFAGLFVVWIAGLWAYTFVFTASLRGLTHGQAFTLNATGSAISNLMPFGGAAGVALTFSICRRWGFGRAEVAVSTLVTGVWNLLARFLLPAVGIAALLLAGQVPDARIAVPAASALVGLIAVVAALIVALAWDRGAEAVGRAADRLARLLPAKVRPEPHRISASLHRMREQTHEVLRTQWPRLTAGMVVYMALQAVLFWLCLWATGAAVSIPVAIAAFALGRLLTAAVVTPGGFGIAEAGSAALLVATGTPAGPAVSAVLLFSIFTFVLEIPLGALFWMLRNLFGRGGRPEQEPAMAEDDGEQRPAGVGRAA
ncbi:hypothetical protein GCM10027569_46550 [Flindersiella endophytica]